MSQTLNDKTILITGAARRIGAAIARYLHECGANLVIHHHNSQHDAAVLAAEMNDRRAGSVVTVAGDLRDDSACRAIVQCAVDTFGALDGLINNASSFFPSPLGEIDEVAWDGLIGTNLRAPLMLSQAAASHLKKRDGAIINIIDIYASHALPGFPLYCTAKSGLAGLTRALAVELAPHVRVNGISPGLILWPENEATLSAAQREDILRRIPLRRSGETTDIARAAHYLLADAPYVTGQVLPVDGGRTAVL
jgi:pteridine reductase